MESLTADEVRYLATLANLHLTEEEVETYRHQLTGILQHVQSLQEVDTTGIEPTGHATDSNTVLREDKVGAQLEREQVIGNAPSTSGEFIRVNAVME
jgi:aspartyl-tRNA(Asn)/glutamyl-tRNA(Gln) amidotransferase subunit C